MKRVLIFYSKDEAPSSFINSLAASAELDLYKVGDPAAAITELISIKTAILLLEVTSPNELFQITLALTQGEQAYEVKNFHNNIHILVPGKIVSDLGEVLEPSVIGSIIIQPESDIRNAALSYSKILNAFYEPKKFQLKTLFSEKHHFESIQLGASDDKEHVVERIKFKLLSADCHTRIASIVTNAVDELLMNAMFDAPIDKKGKHLYVFTPRSTSISFANEKQVELQVGIDSRFIGLGVIDRFGSLKKETLFEKISQLFYNQQFQVDHNTAGAGLGITLTFKSGASILFISEANIRTEVYVFFRRTKHYRAFRKQFQFLSTLFLNSGS